MTDQNAERTTGGSEDGADASPTAENLTDVRFVGTATAAVIEDSSFSADDIASKTVSYTMLVEAGVNPGVAAKIRREHSLSWSFESDGSSLGRRSSQVRGLGEAEREWVAASSGDWTAENSREETNGGPSSAKPKADNADGDDERWNGDRDGRSNSGRNDRSNRDTDDRPNGDLGDRSTSDRTDDSHDGESAWVAASGSARREASSAETDGSGDPIAAEAAWRRRSKPTPVVTLDQVGEQEARDLAEAGITSVRSLATADPEHVADVLGFDLATVRGWRDAAVASRE